MKNILIIILFSLTITLFAADKKDALPWEASKPTPAQHKELVDILWNPLITTQLNDKSISIEIDFNNNLHNISKTHFNTCPLVMEIFRYFYETKYTKNTEVNFINIKMTLKKTELPGALGVMKAIRNNIRNDTTAIGDTNLEEIKILKKYEFQLSNVDLEKNIKPLQSLLNGCFLEELDQLNKIGSTQMPQFKNSQNKISNRYVNSSRSPKDIEIHEPPLDNPVSTEAVKKH